MALIITIDANTIPDADIKTYPISKNVAEFNNGLMASEMDIVLDNTDGAYSDTDAASQFYSTDWADKEVTVYDDELNIYTWRGRIKNVIQDDGPRTVTVKTSNYIRDMVDVTCVVTDTAVTPAEAIYNILVDQIQIPLSYIQYSGFQDAIARQTAGSVTCAITFTSDDNKSCMSVVQELLRMSHCVLYTKNNILCLWQWRAWDGVLGTRLTPEYMIPGTFKSEYDFTIYNCYAVYYNAAGTATKSESTKVATDGDKKFVIPDENVESTTPGDYRILLDTLAGADYVGVQAYTRYANPTKKCSFELDDAMRDVIPGDQVDLFYGDYSGEPVRLTSVEYNPNTRRVKCEGIFLNLPVNVVTRDETAPASPQLIEVLPVNGGLFIKWSQNTEVDLLGYNIYVSPGSEGMWRGVMTNLGPSPIEVKNPAVMVDESCYVYLMELSAGETYYVKVTAIDTSYNESADSNIMYAAPIAASDNLYCLGGSIYIGLTLDIANAFGGSVPSGYMTYLDLDGTYYWGLFITASYQSATHFSEKGLNSLSWKSTSPDIYLKYAESDDGVTWGAWSAEIETWSTSTVALSGKKYLKYIIIFYSESWDDTDTIYIKEIEEAA